MGNRIYRGPCKFAREYPMGYLYVKCFDFSMRAPLLVQRFVVYFTENHLDIHVSIRMQYCRLLWRPQERRRPNEKFLKSTLYLTCITNTLHVHTRFRMLVLYQHEFKWPSLTMLAINKNKNVETITLSSVERLSNASLGWNPLSEP